MCWVLCCIAQDFGLCFQRKQDVVLHASVYCAFVVQAADLCECTWMGALT